MTANRTGTGRYRLHIFDGAYEVLANRVYVVPLDLDGPGAGNVLDRYLQQLTREAGAANEPMDNPRMEVRDATTGVLIRDWSGA